MLTINPQTEHDITVDREAARLHMQVLDAADILARDGSVPRNEALRHQREVLSRTLEMVDARLARTDGGRA